MTNTILTPTGEETRIYEITVLLPGEASDKEKQETLRGIADLFKEKDILVLRKDEWKRMGLAYAIKGQTHGQYVLFYVEGKPAALPSLDQQLKIERGVLRHLIVKLPPKYEVVDWSEHFKQWKEGLVKEEEDRTKEHEEGLKKKIVQRAMRQSTAPASRKSAEPLEKAPAPAATEELSKKELSERLGELISDEDLKL
ncbi:MAG TPA: 30S ribosomal protein S6 [Candidatus Peribacterales bacterium]|nr:30S ribosomal protein S6 [Candidatus Peribacterales bacterium]